MPANSLGSCAVSKREMRSLGNATNLAERFIDDPNTAAAATCFASRVYSDQTKYSIKGGGCLFAMSWSHRSAAPSVSHHCCATVTIFLKLRIVPVCCARGTL